MMRSNIKSSIAAVSGVSLISNRTAGCQDCLGVARALEERRSDKKRSAEHNHTQNSIDKATSGMEKHV